MKRILIRLFNKIFQNWGIRLYPMFKLDSKIFPKIFYFKRMYEKIEPIEGDIVECGIGYSRTFQILCLLAQMENKNRIVWGFDSFEGFPQPTSEDNNKRNPQKGEWKVITLAQVHKILEVIQLTPGFIAENIKIVKGFFEKTLPDIAISKIALLHLDVDLYSSYKICLENLFPKVVQGGIVLFDEYGSESFPGARKAIDEYFKGTNYTISKDDVSGKYYLIKK